WRRTAAPTVPCRASGRRSGAPNTELRLASDSGVPRPSRNSVPVPVLRCAPRWFGDWARLVAFGGRSVPAAVTYVSERAPRSEPAPVGYERPLTVRQRVRRFQSAASRDAVVLAAHTALSTPALPVMRLIQKELLSDADPGTLAEILLSGLLRPIDHEQGLYAFVDGAAETLVSVLPRSTAWRTTQLLSALSAGVRRHADGTTERFPAYLVGSGGDRFTDPESTPFAWVNPDTLALLDPRAARSATAPEEPATGDDALWSPAWVRERVAAPAVEPLPTDVSAREPRRTVVLGRTAPRPVRFVQRKEPRRRLDSLGGGRVLALVGEGGTGKTSIAADHVDRVVRAGDVDLVLWVDASRPENFLQSCAHAALSLPRGLSPLRDEALPGTYRHDPHPLAEVFLGWLGSVPRRWLIVLDGMDRSDEVLGLVPLESGYGQVLVTSRHRYVLGPPGHGHSVVEVGGFTTDEAVDYLARRFFGTRAFNFPGGTRELVEVFDRHPLALSLAASTIVNEELTPFEYLRRRRRATSGGTEEAVYQALLRNSVVSYSWSMSLLLMLRLFGRTAVPLRLLTTPTVRKHLAEQLPRPSRMTQGVRDVLRDMQRRSLIRLEEDADGSEGAVWVHENVRPPVHDLPVFFTTSNTAVIAVHSLLEAWQTSGNGLARTGPLRRSAIALHRNSEEAFLGRDRSRLPDSERVSAEAYYTYLISALERILGPDHEEVRHARATRERWK
uniref:ATP-binding protein n=1 Tax=Nocardiopsis halotolerans TaxID=124252 RepID=UPI0019D33D8A